MIAFLRGAVAARGAGWVEMDVGGVGFHVLVSGHAAAGLPAAGVEVQLPTVLVVREDGMQLFGFRDEEERSAFASLITVAGIGPRIALAILTSLRPAALAAALEREDLTALTRVPGVGRKTAQRLVLELRGKLAGGGPSPDVPAGPPAVAEAHAALVALGYAAADAQSALATLDPAGQDAAQLVRAALRRLGH